MDAELIGLWLGIPASLIAIYGAIIGVSKWLSNRSSGKTPPFIYAKRKQVVKIKSRGECNASHEFDVILNSDIYSMTWASIVDNSNGFPYRNVVITAFIDGEDVSDTIEYTRKNREALKFTLPLPEKVRKKKLFNLTYNFDFGRKYPSNLKELELIRNKGNPDLIKNTYISEGAFIDVPTKELICVIKFENDYPCQNIVAVDMFNSSKDERVISEDGNNTWKYENHRAELSVKKPLQGHVYCIRWNLNK